MRKLFLSVLSLVIFSTGLWGSDEEKVSSIFKRKADEVVSIVKSKSLAKEKRNENIIKTVEPFFDFKLMAKLSLGKNAWRSLSSSKQNEFTDLYVKRMKESFSSKIDSYTNEKIAVEKVIKTKNNRITLVSSLVDHEKKTEVIFKYYKPAKPIKDKEKWLVYDVVIMGVSIIKTDRSQFREVLKANSIDQLMNKMRS